MNNLTPEQVLEVSADKIRKIKKASQKIELSAKHEYKCRKEQLLYEARLRGIEKEYGL